MTSVMFVPSRADGRADRRVVFDLLVDADPDTLITYAELTEVLQSGVDGEVSRQRVYRAIAAAGRLMLKEQRRGLRTVRGVGVRVMRADEHLPVALERKERAEHQFKRGIEMLRDTRLDELSETQRLLHEAQLLIMSGIYQATRETSRRVARQEEAIADIRRRLASLEGQEVVV